MTLTESMLPRNPFNRLLAAVWLFCAVGTGAIAAEPVEKPLLRVDVGMHNAAIRALATDAEGRFLVTASDDKTARVWSLANGELLTTLRPPSGLGNEGNLYAVSMSPDGDMIAVGGWTDEDNSVYLFDRASGRMIRRLAGLPAVVSSLAFNPDGRILAVGLAEGGVRMFAAASGLLLGETSAVAGRVSDLAWSGDRLAAASADGKLWLWGAGRGEFADPVEVAAPAGVPAGIAFSPEGERLAVGYSDARALSLVDGKTLGAPLAVNMAGVNNGSLSAVAWTDDGDTLWAAGRYQRSVDWRLQSMLRRWANGGTGVYNSIAVADGPVTALTALSSGSVVFASTDPSWGLIDGAGRRVFGRMSPVRDFRYGRVGHLQVTRDGGGVQVGEVTFSVRGRQFGASYANMENPRHQWNGVTLVDGIDRPTPRLGNQILALRPFENSRCFAFAADGQSLALGADWSLRRFDMSGREVWRKSAGSPVVAVNVSANGQLLVAAYLDGTIRWHRYTDGQELLALLVPTDGASWALWTPSGYFDASPGGGRLLGFQVNRGKDRAAEFVTLDRLGSKLHRPDVIDQVLGTLDESEALARANGGGGSAADRESIEEAIRKVARKTP